MDSQKWRDYAASQPFPLSLGYALEHRKLEREERRLARRFDLCTATTRAEWHTLQRLAPEAATDWFPNGVDSEYFHPSTAPYNPRRIVFVGRMDYYPNQQGVLWFCACVMPALRARRPDVEFFVVGADPTSEIRKLNELPGVTVTGSVTDVRPYLHEAAVMVAPLRIARGTQNKILEGMASGVPVVASRIAVEGVDANAPEHLVTASEPEEYVEALLGILDDADTRERLSAAGRARVLSHHAWSASMRKLERIVERCIADKRPTPAPALNRFEEHI
jgi:sugar transferase (PEP-CTERM/EpsH1 system associated)